MGVRLAARAAPRETQASYGSSQSVIARHLVIIGRVQGVGYRDAMQDEARRLGVSGWVRNRRDGSVEAELQGTASQVDALIAWARRGPALARVAEVRVSESGAQALPPRFERLPTA